MVRTLAVSKIVYRSCSSLTILTATPFRTYCIRHRRRACSMLPIPPHPHINAKCRMQNAECKIIGEAALPNIIMENCTGQIKSGLLF